MISADLLNDLRALARSDKLHILQVLVSELAQEEQQTLRSGAVYPIWSPYDSPEAAKTLLNLLKTSETKSGQQ